jgi:hypothetical protein
MECPRACAAPLYECILCATSDHPLPFSFSSGTTCFLLCFFTVSSCASSRVFPLFFPGKKETGNAVQYEQSISASSRLGYDTAKTNESMLRLPHNKSGQVLGGEPPAELMGPACKQRSHGLDNKSES